jgi:hypothetical protein
VDGNSGQPPPGTPAAARFQRSAAGDVSPALIIVPLAAAGWLVYCDQ